MAKELNPEYVADIGNIAPSSSPLFRPAADPDSRSGKQEEENLDSVLMIDASDVFFNSNPFDYIHEHENKANQLFVSHDNGNTFEWNSWRVDVCYGEVAPHNWPPGKQQYNAGVWGGQRPAVRCVLGKYIKYSQYVIIVYSYHIHLSLPTTCHIL